MSLKVDFNESVIPSQLWYNSNVYRNMHHVSLHPKKQLDLLLLEWVIIEHKLKNKECTWMIAML